MAKTYYFVVRDNGREVYEDEISAGSLDEVKKKLKKMYGSEVSRLASFKIVDYSVGKSYSFSTREL